MSRLGAPLLVVMIASTTIPPCELTPSTDFVVAALNAEGGGRHLDESATETESRYRQIGRRFLDGAGSWALIGYQELRYRRLGQWPNPVVLESQQMTTENTYGANYMGDQIGADGAATLHALGYNRRFSFDEIAVSFRNAFIGAELPGIIHRTVMGARFKHRYTDLVVPFFVTHISATDDERRSFFEIVELLAAVRSWYVPGDMPPVIVGDFNCATWNAETQAAMLQQFVDVTAGLNEVVRIYVGRPQAFPAAWPLWQPPAKGDARLIDVGKPEYTDHNTPVATVRASKETVRYNPPRPWVPPSATRGCPNTLG
jgi:endonuclease/exonuclease/phosphatase family metal-dependent hydrolase